MASKPLQTLLIGTSLANGSDAVVRAGIALARLHGAAVHLLHAYDRRPTYGGETPEERGCDAGWMEACRALEAQVARVCPDLSTAHQHIRPGAPREVLCDLARELSADLVVLG
ncbi:MAG TPA: universal stress protein, partial [Thermoanaerobaculia bacterium]|nr:universal stress protein [Thermoanaerobaculia bacterium]